MSTVGRNRLKKLDRVARKIDEVDENSKLKITKKKRIKVLKAFELTFKHVVHRNGTLRSNNNINIT